MHVLVTGANGHLGFNLCKVLLERGHKIRASVRSLTDNKKVAPLRALGEVLEQPREGGDAHRR